MSDLLTIAVQLLTELFDVLPPSLSRHQTLLLLVVQESDRVVLLRQ